MRPAETKFVLFSITIKSSRSYYVRTTMANMIISLIVTFAVINQAVQACPFNKQGNESGMSAPNGECMELLFLSSYYQDLNDFFSYHAHR